jgi:putative heme-binding domain-containing protein
MRKAGVKNEIIAIRLGDPDATAAGLKALNDPSASKERRLRLTEVFGEIDNAEAAKVLASIAVSNDRDLAKEALVSLQRGITPDIAKQIAEALPKFSDEVQVAAMNLLASRAESTAPLLEAISGMRIEAKKVPQDVVAKIRLNSPDAALKIFGAEKKQTTGELQVEIDRVNKVLNSGSGSPYEGFKVFSMTCAGCHKLFGQGGQIGPDLTAFKRDDLQNMLLNIVHPNAEIREGYVNYILTTKDGRTLTGFLADEDKQAVVIRGIDGANVTIARAEIQEMKPTGFSLMPEGLMQGLEDQQIRDLFAYLRSTQPLVR